MAFNRRNFSGSMGGGSASLKIFTHQDTASTKAAIATADYFLTIYPNLKAGDGIYCLGSDGAMLLSVLVSSSVTVTTEEATLA